MSSKSEIGLATAAAGAMVIASGAAALAQALPPPGPKSTGRPGPGPFAGGNVDWEDTGIGAHANMTFGNFGCTVFKENADTPDWRTANVHFERGVTNRDVRMPDGRKVRCWIFDDPLGLAGQRERLPSALIRVQEDDLVHVMLDASKGSHTIHHHGIEPTTMNDGVGHVSMEVSGRYTYQWQPRQAGTYFYHCHKNTVTHFEMGLYGLIVIDPKPEPDGTVLAFKDGPAYKKEAFWVLDDMDPRWHEITDDDHDVGLCGDDMRLNVFQPKYFLISGTPTRPDRPCTQQKVSAYVGEQILIRLLNASYSVLKVTFESLDVQIIAADGHPLNKPWNRPVAVRHGDPIYLSTAQRYDIIIDTTLDANKSKVNKVHFEFQDWITRKVHDHGGSLHKGTCWTTVELT